MSRLPALKPKDVLAALQRAGFVVARVRGSHYQLLNPSTKRRVTVPHHTHDLYVRAKTTEPRCTGFCGPRAKLFSGKQSLNGGEIPLAASKPVDGTIQEKA
ncbi:MAG: hypothetical protein DLM68_17660 [Hyphomicrobiales bacterium]|nr:type II toxin-antitoxin system HicA family toxin [Candidatus Eremiobacteraeota bacterium]PZR81524.1 MAG: hypothetical protein DLM68_17660 [Hyphomicrobiales bacterium]